MNEPTPAKTSRLNPLANFIFASRWLQLPLYIGLIAAQAVYVVHFMIELKHLVAAAFGSVPDLQALVSSIGYKTTVPLTTLNETIIMLVVLALIDVVMISNLLIMVIVGGYATFVSRMDLDGHPDQPEWLSHHWYQLDSFAENVYQCRQLHRPGIDCANRDSHSIFAVSTGYCLHRQGDVEHCYAKALTLRMGHPRRDDPCIKLLTRYMA